MSMGLRDAGDLYHSFLKWCVGYWAEKRYKEVVFESEENGIKTDVVMRYPKKKYSSKLVQAAFFEIQSDMEGGAYLERKAIDYRGKTWGCIEEGRYDICSEPEDGVGIEASWYVAKVYDAVAKQLENETRASKKKSPLKRKKKQPDDSPIKLCDRCNKPKKEKNMIRGLCKKCHYEMKKRDRGE